jgi:cytochrome c nitrite reductase small subunit
MIRSLPWILSACLGLLAGLGAFTFRYAEGFSYFSNRPEACANCHVMREYLDSWQKSPHHIRAACNDCHTPHSLLPKLVTKAENGWRHSLKFTLQNYAEHLRITPHNAARLEHNCIQCHQEFVSDIRLAARGGRDDEIDCVRCHAGIGHGPRR